MESSDRPVLRSRAWAVACGFLALLVLVLGTIGTTPPVAAVAATAVTVGCAVLIVVWALLRTRRQRRRYEDELTAWAAERAAQAERLRIARDLHDLASHGLGLITVRAAAARTLTGPAGDAERAAALSDIESAGRQATTELRRMLAVLRTPGAQTPLRPADSLADLPRIVEQARTTGVEADLSLDDLGEVSAGTQLTICAIVREALANIARHAGPTRARIEVRRTATMIRTTITDDGARPGWTPHPGAGTGLTDLRERITALNGSLTTGPNGPGYQLTACLPDPGRP